MWAIDSAINAVAAGFQVYSHKKSLEQERDLHEHDCSLATEQHFQSLSTELLAIAKEADRDVWEQRNNQYNNMIVCATLMFTVPINNINQGAYHETDEGAKYGKEFVSLFTMAGIFTIFTGVSVGSLFVCIVACFVVTRRIVVHDRALVEPRRPAGDLDGAGARDLGEHADAARRRGGRAPPWLEAGVRPRRRRDRLEPEAGRADLAALEAAAGKGKIHFGVQMQPVGPTAPWPPPTAATTTTRTRTPALSTTARYAPVEPPATAGRARQHAELGVGGAQRAHDGA